jgi:hypothetical protein
LKYISLSTSGLAGILIPQAAQASTQGFYYWLGLGAYAIFLSFLAWKGLSYLYERMGADGSGWLVFQGLSFGFCAASFLWPLLWPVLVSISTVGA